VEALKALADAIVSALDRRDPPAHAKEDAAKIEAVANPFASRFYTDNTCALLFRSADTLG
jgi:hypothetical protein